MVLRSNELSSLVEPGWPLLAVAVVIVPLVVLAVAAQRRQLALARTEATLRALMESSTDVLTVSDTTGALTYVSPAAERSLGRSPRHLVGTSLLDLVDAEHRARVGQHLRGVIAAGHGARASFDVLMVRLSGERRWYEWTVHNLLTDALVAGLVVHQRDVTERLLHQDQLAHAAAHDQLTGLPNRGELLRRLGTVLEAAGPGAGVAVLFIDLDRFKEVNDTYGHAAGDELLVVVAQRLRTCLRSYDHLARLGGDEFCAILTEVSDEREVRAVVGRLEAAVAQPAGLTRGLTSVSASIGTALTHEPDSSPAALFAAADAAMYRAKHASRAAPYEPRGRLLADGERAAG